jgi:dihydrofolate synthase/folylpolyglutamate synthase
MNVPLTPPVLATSPGPLTENERAALLRYEAARRYIDVELVRLTKRRHDPPAKVRAAFAWNEALGDPQRAFPAVQVAGTSGKGSVASMIALGLEAAGLRAGLHVSPYLQAFTEKVVIDGRYCAAEDFARAVDEVRPHAEARRHDADSPASLHTLAGLGAAYVAFRAARVEAAVIETNVGGRFDLVQGLDRALSVITDLGLDHTDVLGDGVDRIAWHKAGIMSPGVPCVAIQGPGWAVLEAEAARVGAPLTGVRPEACMTLLTGGRALLRLAHLGEVEVVLRGAPWHARNVAVAATALDALAARGWPVRAEHVARAVARLRYPGRFEVVQEAGPRVLLDGAHNQQKLDALRRALEAQGDPGAIVVFATTGGRDPRPLLEALAPAARALVATAPPLYGKDAAAPAALAQVARALGLDARPVASPREALDDALEQGRREGRTVVVTGSLYLVGQLRDRWVPWEQVVLRRTSWPELA